MTSAYSFRCNPFVEAGPFAFRFDFLAVSAFLKPIQVVFKALDSWETLLRVLVDLELKVEAIVSIQ